MPKRPRIKHEKTLEERLAEQVQRSREAADKALPGADRELLLRRAHQAEAAYKMSRWLTSAELQPPKPRPSRRGADDRRTGKDDDNYR
jgi:hypothetical protein